MHTKASERKFQGWGRATSQRRLLLQLLKEGGHFNADELYQRARKISPNLSLSTVYRNLKLFKKLGLVKELHFDVGHFYYEAPGGDEHHLFCLTCGEILEFQSPLTYRLKEEVAKEHGYEILEVDFHLTGYCPRCRKKRRQQS